jgi:hypothetical protein
MGGRWARFAFHARIVEAVLEEVEQVGFLAGSEMERKDGGSIGVAFRTALPPRS